MLMCGTPTSSLSSDSSCGSDREEDEVEILEEDLDDELILTNPLPEPQRAKVDLQLQEQEQALSASEEEVADVAAAAPQEERPSGGRRKKKKNRDPVAAARRRVQLRLREEVRAARKARRKERNRARRRKGVGVNIDDFLARTKERIERHAVEAEVAALAAAAAARSSLEEEQRGHQVDIDDFGTKTRLRIHSRLRAAQAAAAAHEAERAAKAQDFAASSELETFKQLTHERVLNRLWSSVPDLHSTSTGPGGPRGRQDLRRRRIAIVGAGPVGLWAAFLFAKKYSQLSEHIKVRRPDAPEVIVLEGRPQSSHCSRTDVRIALSSNTQKLLNSRTGSSQFASGMAVAEIEAELLCRWKHVASKKLKLEFGCGADNPATLALEKDLDCVIWAAGRRSLQADTRRTLSCEQRIGESERVLVFQLSNLQGQDPWQHGGDLTGPVRQAARMPTLRTMLRPGLGGQCACYLWLFGLPDETKDAETAKSSVQGQPSMVEALEDLLSPGTPHLGSLKKAAEVLQQRLRPSATSLRWVEASFWSSDHCVADLGRLDERVSGIPIVLVGDAASGKPFYTGTTLNKHFWDVDELINDLDWPYANLLGSLEAHERRYQAEIHRSAGFRRSRGHH